MEKKRQILWGFGSQFFFQIKFLMFYVPQKDADLATTILLDFTQGSLFWEKKKMLLNMIWIYITELL